MSNCWILCQGGLRCCCCQESWCMGWRGQCETTDQLIIVFCGSRIFSLRILPHHAIVQYSMQCIVSCMHFQPLQRHQGFRYTIMDGMSKYYREINLFVDQDSQFLAREGFSPSRFWLHSPHTTSSCYPLFTSLYFFEKLSWSFLNLQ